VTSTLEHARAIASGAAFASLLGDQVGEGTAVVTLSPDARHLHPGMTYLRPDISPRFAGRG
jgi:hypothetical protein